MKVLVPVEDPLFGSAIVKFISSHQWEDGTEFHVINVVEPFLSTDNESGIPHAPMSNLFAVSENKIMDLATQLVQEVAKSIKSAIPQSHVEELVVKGSVSDEILKYAKTWQADLVVAGSHGRGGLQRFFIGSVSMILATDAPCSVLLIKPDSSILDSWNKVERHLETSEVFNQLSWELNKQETKRILIAVDENSISEDIIDFVIKHKWASPTQFKLISVLRNPEHGIFPVSDALKEFHCDAVRLRESFLRRLALKLRDFYLSPHIEEELIEGDPKQAIVDCARLWGADLLIVGCRYRKSLQRVFVGSVSMAVLSTAPCPVLLLKEKLDSPVHDLHELKSQTDVSSEILANMQTSSKGH